MHKKNKKNNKYYFVILFLLPILFLGFNFSLSNQKSITKNEGNNYYPVQYSDSHITQNAIVSDPKFKNVSYFEKSNLLSNVISSFKKTEIYQSPNKQEKGTWLWTDILKITPEYRDFIISEAKKEGINSIYISIDTYLDIFVMNDGIQKTEKQKQFDGILRDFIKKAKKNGISVDAEAGWRNWAEEGNTYKAFAILDYVEEFNLKYEEKFRGIQYDIEPYMLTDFKEKNKEIMGNFISLVDQINSRVSNNLELSFVIPEFYDGVDGRTERFLYGLNYDFAFDHMLRILNKRGNNKIIVMAYRNFADGIDGSVSISKDEIERANKYNVKLVLAQEFGEIEPKIYTFFDTSKRYYEKHIDEIEKSFSGEKSFGGIASHYINAFIELD